MDEPYEKERTAHFDAVNAKKRDELRAKSDPYWKTRREAAKQWLAKAESVKVPGLPKNFPASNEIDRFIAARIASVKAQDSHKGSIDYFKDIQPILEAKCTECHRGAKAKGDLKLDSLTDAAAAIKPGHPATSELIARVTTDDEDEIMPPKGKPLTKSEITLLTQWIKEGAHWPDIRADHLTLTPLTDNLAFLRRVYFDTVGVPPSLAEIEAFQKNPDRKAAIDQLLNDPRWADNWMGYWLDVLAGESEHPQSHAQQHGSLPLVDLRVVEGQQADGSLRHRTAAHARQRAPRRTSGFWHSFAE